MKNSDYIVLFIDPTSGNILNRMLFKETDRNEIENWATHKARTDYPVGTIPIMLSTDLINNNLFHYKLETTVTYKLRNLR